jgi:outer membrane protein assembly factor BamB
VKPIKDRYCTLCSLLLTLVSVVGSLLVLTACQSSASLAPTPPSFFLSHGNIYILYTNTTNLVNDSLAVFRADTGTFLWKESNVRDIPVADTTTVYVPTETMLIAKDAESGKERWHTTEELIPSAVMNGIVYARAARNDPVISFSALRTNDGNPLWTTTFSHSVGGYIRQVEMERDRVYVLTDTNFFVLQASDGKIIWSSPAHSATRANGIIYLSRWQKARDGIVDAVRAEDGKLLWSFHPPTSARVPDLTTSTVTADGILCVNAVDTLYGLHITDGAILWDRPSKSIGGFYEADHPILTANGVLYISSEHEGLLAVQARDGTERWRFDPGGSVNSIDLDSTGGILYATIVPLAPSYVAAVQTNGQFLWKTHPQRGVSEVRAANEVAYQVVPSGVADDGFEHEHYTQIDLTATRGNDGKSLWSTHFPF